MSDLNKLIFGYTIEELKWILAKLDVHHNYRQMLEWLEQNAPDQTYVVEKTVFEVITNFTCCKDYRYPYLKKVCVACNKPYLTDFIQSIYCSDKCRLKTHNERQKLKKKDPDYKPIMHSRYRPTYIREKIKYEDTFDTNLTGEDSLFCDTDFLESLFKKEIKKSKDCK